MGRLLYVTARHISTVHTERSALQKHSGEIMGGALVIPQRVRIHLVSLWDIELEFFVLRIAV